MGFVGVMKPGWSLNWETKIIPCDELGVGATGSGQMWRLGHHMCGVADGVEGLGEEEG